MNIATLEPGQRFRLPDCGKVGTVISTGDGGTRVKYDNAQRQVRIEQDEGTVESPGRPVLISAGTEVEPL